MFLTTKALWSVLHSNVWHRIQTCMQNGASVGGMRDVMERIHQITWQRPDTGRESGDEQVAKVRL